MKTILYHNPRCSKSREALQLLEDSNEDFQVIPYLTDTPTKSELKQILKMLQIRPIELVRTKEVIWKEHYTDENMSDEAIIQAMLDHPRLIERPILVKNNKAAIGRPIEAIKEIL